jgi:type VI secretion system protein ImpI
MALTLRIENETSLPDGGPLSVTVNGQRTIDIGRDQHLDWTLPDPTRYISGKHCEVRHHDGSYWLYDLSTNGTFVNGSPNRVQSPYRLRNNDRLTIGHYIILVTVEGDELEASTLSSDSRVGSSQDEIWSVEGEGAPPLPRSAMQPPREAQIERPDFLDWAADISRPVETSQANYTPVLNPQISQSDEFSWARSTPSPPPPQEPPPQIPTPRRPVRDLHSETPWGGEGIAPRSEAAAAQPEAASISPASRDSQSHVVDRELISEIAAGAGISPAGLQAKETDELARELGRLIRLVVDNLRQLLQARIQAKRLARVSNHTMVQAADNNPLKFAPTSEDALRIMFGPRTASYLDASASLEQAFHDLKAHELKTFSAMQNAIVTLMHDLDPARAEEDAGTDRGLSGLVGSRKAKQWDLYVARWKAKTGGTDAGLIDAFMRYFAEAYERGQR